MRRVLVLLLLCLLPSGGIAAPTLLQSWGGIGSGDGEFRDPFDVAVDSAGDVYVCENINDRVQKFDANGTFLANWGSTGGGLGQFDMPVGIGVAPSGNIWVCERNNHRIQRLGPDGIADMTIGSFGSGIGHFHFPDHLTVATNGLVYVVDRGNDRIVVFSDDGIYQRHWLGFDGEISAIAVDVVHGFAYVTQNGLNHGVRKFDLNGNFLQGWGGLVYPRGIAVLPDGNILVADNASPPIHLFTPDGTELEEWGTEMNLPRGIAVSEGGAFIYCASVLYRRIYQYGTQPVSVERLSWGGLKGRYRR